MNKRKDLTSVQLKKAASGISGLDDITFGGLPQGETHHRLWRPRLRQNHAGNGISGAWRHGV